MTLGARGDPVSYAPLSALSEHMVAPADRLPPFVLGNDITTGLHMSRAWPRLFGGSF